MWCAIIQAITHLESTCTIFLSCHHVDELCDKAKDFALQCLILASSGLGNAKLQHALLMTASWYVHQTTLKNNVAVL